MFRVFALLIAGLLATGSALAADNGVYLGVGIAQSNIDLDVGAASVDDDDTSFKVIVGVRPLDWLAFEANYIDFGTFEPVPGVELDAKGIDAFAVGLLEVGVVDFFAKAGIVRWDASLSLAGIGSDDDSGNEFAYGLGVGAHFGSLGVRAEYEKFQVSDDIDADVDFISLSVTWTFL